MKLQRTVLIASGLLALVFLFSGCWEGMKELTIYNRTGQEITIQTSVASVNNEYKIPADSSFNILRGFGGVLPFGRLREDDLPIDYLKITTPKDTILAQDRSEIIRLIRKNRTKYRKKTDKSFASDNNHYIEAIIIRN